jgi:hypothetical protein
VLDAWRGMRGVARGHPVEDERDGWVEASGVPTLCGLVVRLPRASSASSRPLPLRHQAARP